MISCRLQFFDVLLGPIADRCQRADETRAERRERILDSRRCRSDRLSVYQAVALEIRSVGTSTLWEMPSMLRRSSPNRCVRSASKPIMSAVHCRRCGPAPAGSGTAPRRRCICLAPWRLPEGACLRSPLQASMVIVSHDRACPEEGGEVIKGIASEERKMSHHFAIWAVAITSDRGWRRWVPGARGTTGAPSPCDYACLSKLDGRLRERHDQPHSPGSVRLSDSAEIRENAACRPTRRDRPGGR